MSVWPAQLESVARQLADPRLARLLRLHRRSLMHVLLAGGSSMARAALARAFHIASPVAGGPFVELDCRRDEARLAESLRHRLWASPEDRWADPLREAREGTLFLDHVEVLSTDVQRLLLAVLRERAGTSENWVGRLITGWGVELEECASGERFLRSLLDCLDKVRWELDPYYPREAG